MTVEIGDLKSGDRLLTGAEVAAAAGISLRTLNSYLHDPRRRVPAPAPDVHVGRTPLWRESTVATWLDARNRG